MRIASSVIFSYLLVMHFKTLEDVREIDNALEGAFWSLKERLKILLELSEENLWLNPFKPSPLVRSFSSFKEYESWKEKQKNPWYRI